MSKKVVVPISGGADSSVLLHKAVEEYDKVYAITFDYGQRHSLELKCADIQVIYAKQKGKCIVDHQILDVSFLKDLAPTSSLTNKEINTPDVRVVRGEAQPASYVPNRNMLFLSIAAARAEAVGGADVWHGAAQVDSLAGYWDSSKEFLESINNVLNLNREHNIRVEAPLIELSKCDIIKLGIKYKVKFKDTYTCYTGDALPSIYSASSSLRIAGFIEAGYADPILYKEQKELTAKYKELGVKQIPYENYNFKF